MSIILAMIEYSIFTTRFIVMFIDSQVREASKVSNPLKTEELVAR